MNKIICQALKYVELDICDNPAIDDFDNLVDALFQDDFAPLIIEGSPLQHQFIFNVIPSLAEKIKVIPGFVGVEHYSKEYTTQLPHEIGFINNIRFVVQQSEGFKRVDDYISIKATI